jgi:hypothetical protein
MRSEIGKRGNLALLEAIVRLGARRVHVFRDVTYTGPDGCA